MTYSTKSKRAPRHKHSFKFGRRNSTAVSALFCLSCRTCIVLKEGFKARIHEQELVMNVTSWQKRFMSIARSGFVMPWMKGEGAADSSLSPWLFLILDRCACSGLRFKELRGASREMSCVGSGTGFLGGILCRTNMSLVQAGFLSSNRMCFLLLTTCGPTWIPCCPQAHCIFVLEVEVVAMNGILDRRGCDGVTESVVCIPCFRNAILWLTHWVTLS